MPVLNSAVVDGEYDISTAGDHYNCTYGSNQGLFSSTHHCGILPGGPLPACSSIENLPPASN
ncbi:hypothetical protein [Stutzerimonas kirkiae]|uniref:hypothetical protein n=1 Tax=Stutzerimonas kirkiae TaxID=2211392 RepID=UPI001037BB3E|nr:hypothetical protein [Stutzerimonas kirkiae]